MNLLFWNVNKRGQANTIAALARSLNADVVLLAESVDDPAVVLAALNPVGTAEYQYISPPAKSSVAQLYIKFPPQFITPVSEHGRMTFWEIAMPGQDSFLLGAVHLPSKLWKDEGDQHDFATQMTHFIRETEATRKHDRTVVVGDFNMNPFERGLMNAYAFNAVMTRTEALKLSRVLDDVARPFFFNPMWSLFDDGENGPPGTYHHSSPGNLSVYWNMFDQVLLRPSLLKNFNKSSLRIVTTCGNQSLLCDKGKPLVSDHLPITFSLDL